MQLGGGRHVSNLIRAGVVAGEGVRQADIARLPCRGVPHLDVAGHVHAVSGQIAQRPAFEVVAVAVHRHGPLDVAVGVAVAGGFLHAGLVVQIDVRGRFVGQLVAVAVLGRHFRGVADLVAVGVGVAGFGRVGDGVLLPRVQLRQAGGEGPVRGISLYVGAVGRRQRRDGIAVLVLDDDVAFDGAVRQIVVQADVRGGSVFGRNGDGVWHGVVDLVSCAGGLGHVEIVALADGDDVLLAGQVDGLAVLLALLTHLHVEAQRAVERVVGIALDHAVVELDNHVAVGAERVGADHVVAVVGGRSGQVLQYAQLLGDFVDQIVAVTELALRDVVFDLDAVAPVRVVVGVEVVGAVGTWCHLLPFAVGQAAVIAFGGGLVFDADGGDGLVVQLQLRAVARCARVDGLISGGCIAGVGLRRGVGADAVPAFGRRGRQCHRDGHGEHACGRGEQRHRRFSRMPRRAQMPMRLSVVS